MSEQTLKKPAAEIPTCERMIHQINALYEDINTRLDPNKWDEVIKDEALRDVETFRILKTWFLDFLYAGHYVPREVIQSYYKCFLWELNAEKYLQEYDEVFLTYIKEQINGIITPGYEYLRPENCEDINKYIEYREQGFALFLSGNLNNAQQNLTNALDIIPNDPYLMCIFGAYRDATDNVNGRKYIRVGAIISDDPWRMYFFSGQLLHRIGKLKKALRYYKMIPDDSDYYIAARSAITDCLCAMGKYCTCGFLLRRQLRKNREDLDLLGVLLQYYVKILDLKRSYPNRMVFWYEARMTYPYLRKDGCNSKSHKIKLD